MKKILILIVTLAVFNCKGNAQKEETTTYKVTKSKTEWKQQLTDTEYYVLRESGTEPKFSSPLNKNYKKGIYVCKGCETPLFKSEHKFDSGTGWPSFDQEIKGNVAFSKEDHIYYGQEEHCATCGGHLGHVFNDGPKNTTGMRHCINGVALKFIPSEK
ncbi:peptide-methionine (R)-S-oxide reductase MsrB [Aestuariibaculum sediminum]|uniref:peptide-methionine (R)-S-oxide reductase n=1 Tax=Aestuariibaculum sediminum TaxID=2770637 RepID=A0A8J6UFX6_9FLAO|nr:peptide-methionine (R)-S-oxide reductase MsrB [Aestuariibaculum sediminum]MBD0831751.1 peptide-methionine (R)-S-oxide reductase MsrB [Aestuariibaculum sediminum]